MAAVAAAAASLGLYAARSLALTGPGFPLDDAWIHQTYARNLVQLGQWAFVPGEPSAGSTSPLWALIQAPSAVFGLSPVTWSAAVGWLMLGLTGWLAAKWVIDDNGWVWPAAAAAAIIFEWHLAWAALSGMETLAMAGIALAIVWGIDRRPELPVLWGVLVGLSAWIRPDGLTLGLAYAWKVLLDGPRDRAAWSRLVKFGFGVLLLLVPYLGFNLALSGQIWPNTFFAKQAEYAILTQTTLVNRLGREGLQPLVGPGLILLPGLIVWVFKRGRLGEWSRLAPVAWALAYLGIFALRLPAVYQHGRYTMPTIPILTIIGLLGLREWTRAAGSGGWRWIVSRAWLATWGLILGIFWVLGSGAYAQDVAIINTEMVQTADWIRDHTQPADLIAAHDIGALGYFGGRPILDLAGLVNPEVIPFIRDEARLSEYLDSKRAAYLMTFPGWYPELTSDRAPIYAGDAPFSLQAGGEHMSVYRWQPELP